MNQHQTTPLLANSQRQKFRCRWIGSFLATSIVVSSLVQPVLGIQESPTVAIETTPAEYAASESNAAEETSISEWLEKLDSPKYPIRESATAALSSLGRPALEPMARHFLYSSPEASWRIKTSMERIATSGDEGTFLQAVALLQLLVGSDNKQVQLQLAKLKSEWANRQTIAAIERLKQAGATVNNFRPPTQPANELQLFSGANVAEAPSAPLPILKIPLDKQIEMIGRITNGSTKENRKLVLGNQAKPVRVNPNNQARQIVVNQGNPIVLRNGMGMFQANQAATIKFGKNWKGNKAAFRELENIRGLGHVSLANQSIDRSKLETLAELNSLTTLEFDDCRFSGPALAVVGLPKSINRLVLRNQDIQVSMIDRIGKLEINSLTFDRCDFSKSALPKLSTINSLNQLEFSEIELGASIFARMEKMKALRALKLSKCKFPYSAYKRLTKERPEIYVDFTTAAFLGVRSVPGVGNVCQISEVVADSGAERGGIKAQDIIKLIDGQPIESFDDLRAQISLHKDGDRLNVVVWRNSEDVKLVVTLGNFADAPEE